MSEKVYVEAKNLCFECTIGTACPIRRLIIEEQMKASFYKARLSIWVIDCSMFFRGI